MPENTNDIRIKITLYTFLVIINKKAFVMPVC